MLSTSSFAESVWELPPVHGLNSSEHNRQCLKRREEIQLTKQIQSGDPLTADGSSGQILLLQTEENSTTMTRTQITLTNLGFLDKKISLVFLVYLSENPVLFEVNNISVSLLLLSFFQKASELSSHLEKVLLPKSEES